MQHLIIGDCRTVMKQFANEFFHIVVTSPPYNLGVRYADWNDMLSWSEYLSFAQAWLAECYRILVHGGRLCVNVPIFTYKNRRCLLGEYFSLIARCGFTLRETIIWCKKRLSDGWFVCRQKLYGSVGSPLNPHIRGVAEAIIVAHKSQTVLDGNDSDISIDEYSAWTKNVWEFDTVADRRHPAPFPFELPRRVIKLFSFRDSRVLDPFAGRGTTLRVAQELGRDGYGIELSSAYVPLVSELVGSQLRVKHFDSCLEFGESMMKEGTHDALTGIR